MNQIKLGLALRLLYYNFKKQTKIVWIDSATLTGPINPFPTSSDSDVFCTYGDEPLCRCYVNLFTALLTTRAGNLSSNSNDFFKYDTIH